jgi:hypothetical protein
MRFQISFEIRDFRFHNENPQRKAAAMTYQRFEDLPVWQAAIALGVEVYALVENRAFSCKGDLRDQLQRSALSISNNIAEGFERGSTPELLMYLYIARGSAGETRATRRPYPSSSSPPTLHHDWAYSNRHSRRRIWGRVYSAASGEPAG